MERAGELQDAKAVIPDRCYAGIYQAVIEDCRDHGPFDPATMGSVPNVGLMAQAAEEYGSHDKTFKISGDGTVRVIDDQGTVLLQHPVEGRRHLAHVPDQGRPIRDWVKLAVTRARLSNTPVVFWLDPRRDHDRGLIAKVAAYLNEHDTTGLDISILSPIRAMRHSLKRIRAGLTPSPRPATCCATTTDLFPIMELGTSAKMLSIVPLMNGGGLFETGAGGSAPGTSSSSWRRTICAGIRWANSWPWPRRSSTSRKPAATRARRCWRTRSTPPTRSSWTRTSRRGKLGTIDNRGSHFYIALYWAQGAGRTDRGCVARRDLRAAGAGTGRQRGDHRRRAARGAGQAGRHRRLLPA